MVSFVPVQDMPKAVLPEESITDMVQLETDDSYVLSNLSSYVLSKFEEAKRAKSKIEPRLIDCLERFESRYSQSKLAEIRSISAPEIYIPLTSIKVRALTAWLIDVLFQTPDLPYDIAPTPIPELPLEVQNVLARRVYETIMPMMDLLPLNELQSMALDAKNLAEKELKIEIDKWSKKLAEGFKKRLDDVFIEGGFPEALSAMCVDIAIFPTAIIKGGILRKEKGYVRTKYGLEPKNKVIYTFNRVSPFNAYPAPYSSGFENYFIEVLNLLPDDLYKMVGMPGYNSQVLVDVLDRYEKGYKFHHLSYGLDKESLEAKDGALSSDYEYIDMLEFWGPVKGSLLRDFGISVPNNNEYYEATVWVIEDNVVKAVLNENPLGLKPYAKASFIDIPDSFWGQALPEVLSPIQDSVNAFARAAVVNAVLASGPLVERNIDRVDPSQPKMIIPWHMYDAHDSALNSAPAYRFTQPQFIADRLSNVMAYYLKMADETCGIPSYAHGDITVGGAGRTATGLSMLTNNATRGIKAVLRNIDKGIIEPIVKRQYYTLIKEANVTDIPDLKIRTRGSISLAEREMEATRALEFLRVISNPMDSQLIPLDGRRYLLTSAAKATGFDPDRIFGYEADLQQMLQPLIQATQAQFAQEKSPINRPQNPAVQMGLDTSQFANINGRAAI